MDAISIQPLTEVEPEVLRSLIRGYTSNEKYKISKSETETRTTITLELEDLDQPYHKSWPSDVEMEDNYKSVLQQGFSLGLYSNHNLVGLAIAEKREWNRTLWVWEFHIHPDYQGQGWGRKMMETLADLAIQTSCRVIVCETQNTNLPAIRFYRKLGFQIDAVDLSYYTNQDTTDFEVAVFMKRYIHP
jgi:ribosomal protein S18 acetylase RimI-like enzyme